MQTLPPLNALRAFEAAARRGGLKAAAEELAVTPAAVGQQVRHLEDIIGAQLFERRGRTLVLTDRGAAGLERLSRALDLMGEASAAMRAGDPGRTLTLAAPRDLLCAFLAPRLARFAQDHTDIALRLQPVSGREPGALFADGADLALIYAAETPAGLHGDLVLGESLTPAAAPDLAHAITRPGDLAGAPLIHDTSYGARMSGVDWRGWLAARGAYGVDADAGLQIGDSQAALEAAAGGAGVVLARRALAAQAFRSGRLRALFADGDMASRAGWRLVAPAGRAASSAAADMARWLGGQAARFHDAADEL